MVTTSEAQSESRFYLVVPKILRTHPAVPAILLLYAGLAALAEAYMVALGMLYLTAYFGHGLLLPRPYLEITQTAVIFRSPYYRYTIPWSDIRDTHESVWPRRKGLKGLLWAIVTGQIRIKPVPVLVVELNHPHWYVGGLLIPPTALPLRDTYWDLFRSDDFDEFFERIADRVAIETRNSPSRSDQ